MVKFLRTAMMYFHNCTLSTGLVIIYAAAWGYAFFKHRKKCAGSFGSGSFILLTYLLYAVSAVFLYYSIPDEFGEMHLLQFVYLFALLYIGITPVLLYDTAKIRTIIPPPDIVIKSFTFIYIISTILSIPSAISQINEGLVILITDPSGGADLYNERLSSGRVTDYGISNIFSIFYNIFNNCAILVYFYYLTIPKGKKLILLVLSFAIFSSIFTSLASGNRTQLAFSVLTICASYLLFRDFYNQKIKRLGRIIALFLGIIIAFLLLILTISRFGDLNDGGANSLLYYIGQAPLYFNEYAFDAGGVRYGDRTINLFKKLFGFRSCFEMNQKF